MAAQLSHNKKTGGLNPPARVETTFITYAPAAVFAPSALTACDNISAAWLQACDADCAADCFTESAA